MRTSEGSLKRAGFMVVALAALSMTGACTKSAAVMTPCYGNQPAVERTIDVAPPTCDPVLPGTPLPIAGQKPVIPVAPTAPAAPVKTEPEVKPFTVQATG
jgi:hypothetical protein